MAHRCVHGKTAVLRCQECHEVSRARVIELEAEVAAAEQFITDNVPAYKRLGRLLKIAGLTPRFVDPETAKGGGG